MSHVYPQGTVEYVSFEVRLNNILVTSGVEASLVKDGTAPTVWSVPPVVDGELSILLTGTEAVGVWRIWARATAAPEIAKIDCGFFNIV